MLVTRYTEYDGVITLGATRSASADRPASTRPVAGWCDIRALMRYVVGGSMCWWSVGRSVGLRTDTASICGASNHAYW